MRDGGESRGCRGWDGGEPQNWRAGQTVTARWRDDSSFTVYTEQTTTSLPMTPTTRATLPTRSLLDQPAKPGGWSQCRARGEGRPRMTDMSDTSVCQEPAVALGTQLFFSRTPGYPNTSCTELTAAAVTDRTGRDRPRQTKPDRTPRARGASRSVAVCPVQSSGRRVFGIVRSGIVRFARARSVRALSPARRGRKAKLRPWALCQEAQELEGAGRSRALGTTRGRSI